MQPVVKPVVKPVEQPAVQLYSRLDKRLHRVNTHSTGCQIGCETLWQPVGCLFTRCSLSGARNESGARISATRQS